MRLRETGGAFCYQASIRFIMQRMSGRLRPGKVIRPATESDVHEPIAFFPELPGGKQVCNNICEAAGRTDMNAGHRKPEHKNDGSVQAFMGFLPVEL